MKPGMKNIAGQLFCDESETVKIFVFFNNS